MQPGRRRVVETHQCIAGSDPNDTDAITTLPPWSKPLQFEGDGYAGGNAMLRSKGKPGVRVSSGLVR